MSGLDVKVDAAAIGKMAQRIGAIPRQVRPAARMALNDTGNRARTPMKRALVAQTGLKPKVITAALRQMMATNATLAHEFRTRGGNIRLKFFAARETRRGVSAAPRNQRRIFPGTFIKGGRFPDRRGGPSKSGHVFYRAGTGRFPLRSARSGVFIPKEMVTGASAEAFRSTAARVLPDRLAHHLGRAIAGR